MRQGTTNSGCVMCYEASDLDDPYLRGVLAMARAFWQRSCEQYLEEHGDAGTCVLDAGIKVNFIGRGNRRAETHTLIHPSDVIRTQGSVVWEASAQEVVSLINACDIPAEVFFDPDHMD